MIYLNGVKKSLKRLILKFIKVTFIPNFDKFKNYCLQNLRYFAFNTRKKVIITKKILVFTI